LDKVDPYAVFNEIMNGILESPGNELIVGLDGEQQACLQQVRSTVMVPFGFKDGEFKRADGGVEGVGH
jgi:hypothetical protein